MSSRVNLKYFYSFYAALTTPVYCYLLYPLYTSSASPWCDTCVPGACGEGGGEGRDQARQETEGVLASEAKVDERQDNATVDNVAQDRSKDVFSQTGNQKNHVLHLHNLTAHQEHDAEWDIPGGHHQMHIVIWTLGIHEHDQNVSPLLSTAYAPHDPGHQHHGGLIESIKEANELLPLVSQLSQRHTKHHGK